MPILAHCPACRQGYTIPDQLAGQQVSCRCGQVFAVRAAAPPSPVVPAPPRAFTPAAPPLATVPTPPQRSSSVLPLVLLLGGGLLLLLGGGAVALVLALVFWKTDSTTATGPVVNAQAPPDKAALIEAQQEKAAQEKGKGPEEKGKAPPFDPLAWDDKLKIELDEPVNLPPPPDKWEGHWEMIRGVAFSPDGKLAVSASGDIDDSQVRDKTKGPDKSVRLWDARRGKELNSSKRLTAFAEGLATVAFSPGGRYVACASGGRWVGKDWVPGKDTHVHLWDVLKGTEVFALNLVDGKLREVKGEARFKGHTGNVICVAFSPNGKRLAACSEHGDILVWETETGKEIRRIKQATDTSVPIWPDLICSIAFSPDGKYLISGGYDYTVRLWDVDTGSPLKLLRSHTDRVFGVAIRRDAGGGLVGLSAGGGQWSKGADGKVTSVAGTRDYAVRLWDLAEGRVLRSFEGHTAGVVSVAFCPNGKHVVSAGFDGTVRVWDRATGQQLRSFQHTAGVRCIAVRHDGKYVLAGDDKGNIRLWELPADTTAQRRPGRPGLFLVQSPTSGAPG